MSTTPSPTDTSIRRRSFGIFNRSTASAESLSTNGNDDGMVMKTRPKSFFGGSINGNNYFVHEVSASISPNGTLRSKIHPSKLSTRPKSMFGSFKARDNSLDSSKSSSTSSTENSNPAEVSKVIVYCGEALSSGGLLRRKKEYFVLTDSELLRFKTQQKAIEALGYSENLLANSSSGRTASFGSIHDMTTTRNVVTPLSQIIAVYQPKTTFDLDGNSNYLTIDYLDESGMTASTTLQLPSIQEATIWLVNLTKATYNAQISTDTTEITDELMEYVARRVEAEKDYVPGHFKVFRVVQRGGKSPYYKTGSADDLQKIYSSAAILAIGYHKIHIIPMPKTQQGRSNSLLSQTSGTSISHGIMTMTQLAMANIDDSFYLTFRFPCRHPITYNLASARVIEIVQSIRQRAEYLRPNYHIAPYTLQIPEHLMDSTLDPIPDMEIEEENANFERTLVAYCMAYNVDASNIAYGVFHEVEDGPQFVLSPPVNKRRKTYTDLEILAIFRALRWNESFGSISFKGVILDSLQNIFDPHGDEYEIRYLRDGSKFSLSGRDNKNCLLIQELRGLALYSTKLRRLDFSMCSSRKRRNSGDFTSGQSDDEGCGFVEALMPLCRRGLTNVDWFNFTGIELVEADLDWLVDAAATRVAHFRGFEMARCGLTERMLTLFLQALAAHENTLECIDICGNPGRLHAPYLNDMMMYFPFLRKLSLSRLLLTNGSHPLLTVEVLFRWRLESLDLSETHLNEQSVDAIAAYLATDQSDALHHLNLTQCGLNARDVAVLMHSMSREPGVARDMHLLVSQNQLIKHHDKLLDCIEGGLTPRRLTMRMVDYQKEEMFRELIRAVTWNTTLELLDISKVSLPFEASQETCMAIAELFERNKTLKELDISGEQAVLETAKLGLGLNKALGSLAHNTSLEVLRIELQSLGNSGAIVLSETLMKNRTLRQLYCERNGINLQGFSAMVNALENNTTLLYLPNMERDKLEHFKRVKESFAHLYGSPKPGSSPNSAAKAPSTASVLKSGLRRRSKTTNSVSDGPLSPSTAASRRVSFLLDTPKLTRPTLGSRQLSTLTEDDAGISFSGVATQQDAERLAYILEGKWKAEQERLAGFLLRNNGLECEDGAIAC